MWAQGKASPKDFFNHCKLAVIGGDSPLANEIRESEGLTRFFAGTETALRLSISRLLAPFAVVQLLYVLGLIFLQGWVQQLQLPTEINVHVFCTVFTFALIGVAVWVCRRILKRFRGVRTKEAMIVYHAFYLDAEARKARKREKGGSD
jgi:hypothetical protein